MRADIVFHNMALIERYCPFIRYLFEVDDYSNIKEKDTFNMFGLWDEIDFKQERTRRCPDQRRSRHGAVLMEKINSASVSSRNNVENHLIRSFNSSARSLGRPRCLITHFVPTALLDRQPLRSVRRQRTI